LPYFVAARKTPALTRKNINKLPKAPLIMMMVVDETPSDSETVVRGSVGGEPGFDRPVVAALRFVVGAVVPVRAPVVMF
jgi:hypothetical protein